MSLMRTSLISRSSLTNLLILVAQEPTTKYERIQRTVNLAKERARKTSVTIMGGAGSTCFATFLFFSMYF